MNKLSSFHHSFYHHIPFPIVSLISLVHTLFLLLQVNNLDEYYFVFLHLNRFVYWFHLIKEDQHKINDKIDAKEVRVVGEGIEPGVYPIAKALELAEEKKLDLVEVAGNAEPPVCRIMDYGKFKYEKEKKDKAAKKNQKIVLLKEIRKCLSCFQI